METDTAEKAQETKKSDLDDQFSVLAEDEDGFGLRPVHQLGERPCLHWKEGPEWAFLQRLDSDRRLFRASRTR